MARLHILVAIAAIAALLRGGLNLAKLYGLPAVARRGAPASCHQQQQPAPPFSLEPAAAHHHHQQLLRWLRSQPGAVVDHLRVADFENGLRGLQATRDFSRHDLLLSVPTPLTVSVGTISAARSAASSRLLQQLLELPDGDVYLDVVAVLHEALLLSHQQKTQQQQQQQEQQQMEDGETGKEQDTEEEDEEVEEEGSSGSSSGSSSSSSTQPEAAVAAEGRRLWLATLPRHVELPLFLGSSWMPGANCSNNTAAAPSPCQQLTAVLPHLDRLIRLRRQGLAAAWPRVQALLLALLRPSGAASALQQLAPADAWAAFLWSYAIAKTRGVGLEVQVLPWEGRPALQQLGVDDVGVLTPLLDMANHGQGKEVNSRVVGDGAAFRLVATQSIKQGEQVFISYNPADDEQALCSWRWLLEYGFVPGATVSSNSVPHSEDPRRWCFAMNFTLDMLLDTCGLRIPPARPAGPSGAGGSSSRQAAKLEQQHKQDQREAVEEGLRQLHKKLQAVGLDDTSFWIELDGTGELPEGLVEWLGYLFKHLVAAAHGQHQQQQGEDVTAAGGVTATAGEAAQHQDGDTRSAEVCAGCGHCEALRLDECAGADDDAFERCVALCILGKVLQKQQDSIEQQLVQQREHTCPAGLSTLQGQGGGDAAQQVYGGGDVPTAATSCSTSQLQQLLRVAWEAHAALQVVLERMSVDAEQAAAAG